MQFSGQVHAGQKWNQNEEKRYEEKRQRSNGCRKNKGSHNSQPLLPPGFCDEGEVYIVPMNFGYTEEEGKGSFIFTVQKKDEK